MNKNETIILKWMANFDGELVPVERLNAVGGAWVHARLCTDTSEYGLGTCHCRSHRPWDSSPIDEEYAQHLIERLAEARYEVGEARFEDEYLAREAAKRLAGWYRGGVAVQVRRREDDGTLSVVDEYFRLPEGFVFPRSSFSPEEIEDLVAEGIILGEEAC